MTIGDQRGSQGHRSLQPGLRPGGLVFTAGQIALDPVTREVVDGGVAEQTEQVFHNLRAVLEVGGSGLDQVLKTTVFLVDMADFAAMNEVYAKHFGTHRPARSTVAVAGLPRGVRVEIEAVARSARSMGSGSGLVAWPVFKTATETPPVSSVGSIPTRSRHFLLGAAVADDKARSAVAQDSASVATPPPAASDTVAVPHVSPMGAFWRSLPLPGWGQAKLDRRLTGGIFLAFEGITLGMAVKARQELEYLRRTNSGRADNKRQEHEDWLVLLVFNHLFAALDAFVRRHLCDFPDDLKLQATPGGVGGSVSIPIRIP